MSNIIDRDTIGDMARRAATKYGDKIAIIFRDIKLSFYDLEREARRFANLITSYGIKKGDKVAVYAYNSHYYSISMIGLSDPKWIEIVAAVVVPKKGASINEKEIIVYCKKHMAGFKCPKKVFIADKLPKNPSGKILKRELKETYKV